MVVGIVASEAQAIQECGCVIWDWNFQKLTEGDVKMRSTSVEYKANQKQIKLSEYIDVMLQFCKYSRRGVFSNEFLD